MKGLYGTANLHCVKQLLIQVKWLQRLLPFGRVIPGDEIYCQRLLTKKAFCRNIGVLLKSSV